VQLSTHQRFDQEASLRRETLAHFTIEDAEQASGIQPCGRSAPVYVRSTAIRIVILHLLFGDNQVGHDEFSRLRAPEHMPGAHLEGLQKDFLDKIRATAALDQIYGSIQERQNLQFLRMIMPLPMIVTHSFQSSSQGEK
jgi:hypothetical protein